MDQDQKKPGNHGWWLAALLPVLYVLSVGPAARWCVKHPGQHPVLLWVYAPIGRLAHTPLEEPLNCYINWWER